MSETLGSEVSLKKERLPGSQSGRGTRL